MFTNITEEELRVNCPEYAPMTIKMLNKLNPLKVNNSVNPLNPYIERRTAPTSINQFVKTSTYTFSRPASQAGALMDRLLARVDAEDVLPIADEVLPDVPAKPEPTLEPTPEPTGIYDPGAEGLGGESPIGVEGFELVENEDGSYGVAVDPFDDGGGMMLRGADKRKEETLREEIAALMADKR